MKFRAGPTGPFVEGSVIEDYPVTLAKMHGLWPVDAEACEAWGMAPGEATEDAAPVEATDDMGGNGPPLAGVP